MPSTSAPPTPLFPTSGNKALCLPSQLPMRSGCLKSAGLDGRFDDLKTPLTPPAAYMEFLRSAVVIKTPTSAKFDLPPTSAPPLSAGCTCHLQKVTIFGKKPPTSRESSTSSISSVDSTGSLSSASSASSGCSCSNEYTYGAPPTPCTPGPLKTPLSGTKRLRIPPSPAFSSPGFSSSGHTFCDSPVPIYATLPRTPIAEESEEEDDLKNSSPRQKRRTDSFDPAIKSAGLMESHSASSCRHHQLVRKVLIPRTSSALARTARMNLAPAPKGKKRRTE